MHFCGDELPCKSIENELAYCWVEPTILFHLTICSLNMVQFFVSSYKCLEMGIVKKIFFLIGKCCLYAFVKHAFACL